eukprot:Pgem_evm1s3643
MKVSNSVVQFASAAAFAASYTNACVLKKDRCDTPFNLTLVRKENPTKYDHFFEEAAAKWRCIITSNHSLEITYSLKSLDGPGGLLGQASPSEADDDTYLPTVALMEFDTDDLEVMLKDGIIDDTILHEMAHSLGVGTLWGNIPESVKVRGNLINYPKCNAANESDTEAFLYLGEKAIAAYHKLGFAGELTVENGYGAGSKCLHWDEDIFPYELMSPIVNPVVKNLVSELTLATLEDLGWEVDHSKADPMDIESSGACFIQSYNINDCADKLSKQNLDKCGLAKGFSECFKKHVKYTACADYQKDFAGMVDQIADLLKTCDNDEKCEEEDEEAVEKVMKVQAAIQKVPAKHTEQMKGKKLEKRIH